MTEAGPARAETIRETIEACQRGDREAFHALFNSYRDRVYSMCLRFTGEPASANDVAQEAFVKLWAKIGEFRGDAGFDTWLYRLVVNACFDSQRKGWRLVPFAQTAFEAIRATGDSVLQRLMRAERQESVQKAIRVLPADLRMVIVLRYTEALSYEEIAEVLGCSRGTVASRLNRAHRLLERKLDHLRPGNHPPGALQQ